jgi:hypothetical protein
MENTNRINKERVKQMKGWESMPDEFAEKMVITIKRLSEIIYASLMKHAADKVFTAVELTNPELKLNAV